MKNLLAVVFLALCVLLIGETTVPAQGKTGSLFAVPKHLRLKSDGNSVREYRNMIPELFFPIGWSKDGKFAYYVEPPDEECGCYYADIVIQDMQTDKILWEKKYDSSDGGPATLAAYWKKNQLEFSGKLNEYGIIAQPRFSLISSVINYKADVLTPLLTDTTKLDDDLRVSGSVILRMSSKKNGKKTIYEQKFDPKEYGGFLGAGLTGSLVSPFEPRAAIIMIEKYRGWEGPPNTTKIRLVGTTLTNGF